MEKNTDADKPAKELRDAIHGFIPVYKHELEIIEDPVFQRLRRIKQLSFGYFVYHGAEHSRFGHSLGVMHTVGLALDKITENGEKHGSKASVEHDDVKVARLAALLHDVGHYTFSHALDKTSIIGENHEKYSKAPGIEPLFTCDRGQGRSKSKRSGQPHRRAVTSHKVVSHHADQQPN